jgi:Ca2+-transporting ATPase
MGRAIYDNIPRAMHYILADHEPNTGMALLQLFTGGPMLLFPLHVVFLELIIDPACSIVFEREAPAPDLMRRRPRTPGSSILGWRTLLGSLGQGFIMFLVVLATYEWAQAMRLPAAQSAALAFTALVAGNLGLIVRFRSGTSLLAKLGQPNAAFWIVACLALGFLALATRSPAAAGWFGFSPPPIGPWLLALLLPLVVASILTIAQRERPEP